MKNILKYFFDRLRFYRGKPFSLTLKIFYFMLKPRYDYS